MNSDLAAHLATGLTTVCRCWLITRRDGVELGFTEHDEVVQFAGFTFRPDSGMTTRAVMQGTGMSVDNSEAMGVLTSDVVTEADIEAGRFDGAEVQVWLVNWQSVGERALRFRGRIGDIRRGAGAFHVELRGLTDALNQPQGRVYNRNCGAVLGDKVCKFDLGTEGYGVERQVEAVENGQVFRFGAMSGFAPRWFERGRLVIESGAAAGLFGVVKHDQQAAGGPRVIELWEPIRALVAPGDRLRIEAGCDKRAETCRFRFNNLVNFQGFPFIPGEDWLVATPLTQPQNPGGSQSA